MKLLIAIGAFWLSSMFINSAEGVCCHVCCRGKSTFTSTRGLPLTLTSRALDTLGSLTASLEAEQVTLVDSFGRKVKVDRVFQPSPILLTSSKIRSSSVTD